MENVFAHYGALRLRNLFGGLSRRVSVAQQRARLLELDGHLLDDIGLTRADVLREANRPLWNAPDHWQRS